MGSAAVSRATALAVTAVVLLAALASWPLGASSGSGPVPTGAEGAALSVPGAFPSAATAPPVPTGCWATATPCAVQPDQAVVDLLANDSGSGERVALTVQLPPAGSDTAAVETSFWTGLWVTGAPCSLDGASYLRVVLYPPDSPAVVPSSSHWVAQVPVTDLAPAGTCDPLCQNASAATTIDGIAACEDNLVRGGGWAPSPSIGRFAPGDRLTITLWGNASAPAQPLTVWVNDTTEPNASARWQYGPTTTVTGLAVAPRYAVSNASDAGWLTPSDAAFGVTNCPAASGPSPCLSYNGPVSNLTESASPLVSSVGFWNATGAAWDAFPWIGTASTSGGCSGGLGLAACGDFDSDGGTGTYPAFSVVSTSAGAAWRFGGGPGVLGAYGGSAAEYVPTGNATVHEPGLLRVSSTSGSAGVATVNVSVADPRGISGVRASTDWCYMSGDTNVSAAASANGTRANLSLTLDVAPENGTMTVWIQEAGAGGAWSVAAPVSVTMTGGGSPCTIPAPAPPWFGSANVSSVAGGYHLTWAENSSDVRGFVVNATSSSGPPYHATQYVGAVSNATVLGLNGSETYTLSVTALGLEGGNSSATATPTAPPAAPLVASATGGPTTVWAGSGSRAVNVTIAGGATPYEVVATLDTGANVSLATSNSTASLLLPVGSGLGFVSASVTVTDVDGVSANPTPVLWDVWAGPLAPNVTASGGEGFVAASWLAPVSPVSPATNYTVFLTANGSRAAEAPSGGTANSTLGATSGGVLVWNTTSLSVFLPWENGVTAYVVVVPYDALGVGFANAGAANATPANLSVGPVEGGPGGPAPYTVHLSTVVGTGTDDALTEAIYSFPGFQFVAATVNRTNATSAVVEANATVSTVGLDLVFLHVSDAFGGVAIGSTSIWVSVGAAASVTAEANPSPAYVGVAVNFSASAAGPGPFVYNWTFGDGANGSGASAHHTFALAGTYTARVTVVDNATGASSSSDVVELVYARPAVTISDGAGPNGSGSYTFRALMFGGSGNGSFVWTFGDGSVGRGANATHDYLASGVYLVGVVATDASLRTAHANLTVNVVLSGGGTTGGSPGEFTPLADGLFAAAVIGWALAILLLLRRPPSDDADDDEDDD